MGSDLVEAAVEELLDVGPFEGHRLEVSFEVVVEERQRLPAVCRTHNAHELHNPGSMLQEHDVLASFAASPLSQAAHEGSGDQRSDSRSRMTPTSGSFFWSSTSHRAKGSSGVSGSSLNSRLMV